MQATLSHSAIRNSVVSKAPAIWRIADVRLRQREGLAGKPNVMTSTYQLNRARQTRRLAGNGFAAALLLFDLLFVPLPVPVQALLGFGAIWSVLFLARAAVARFVPGPGLIIDDQGFELPQAIEGRIPWVSVTAIKLMWWWPITLLHLSMNSDGAKRLRRRRAGFLLTPRKTSLVVNLRELVGSPKTIASTAEAHWMRARKEAETDRPKDAEASDLTAQEEAAFAFGQEVLDLAIDLVTAAALPPITSDSPRDPKIVGLTLLCRSITNFRGALVLARSDHAVESRALVRLIFENFFFVAALCERGTEFVKAMRSDEAANRKALGEQGLKRLTEDAKNGEHGQIIRTQIRRLLDEFPKPRKFHINEVAGETVADRAYLSYAILSMDAAHPSITALRRHLRWETEGETRYLTLNVVPRFTSKERLATLDEACTALLGVCVGVNQLLGGTTKSEALKAKWERFETQGLHARA
jgi:hypothetical protein